MGTERSIICWSTSMMRGRTLGSALALAFAASLAVATERSWAPVTP
jgi:hypothetical protein